MKKREIVLVIILILLLSVVGYYFFYFMPASTRIAALKAEVNQQSEELEFSSQQALLWGTLLGTKERITADWSVLSRTLPQDLDDADVLNRIQRIIISRTTDVSISFPDSGTQQEITDVHTVEISFTVSYAQLQEILADFAAENVANRVVTLNYTRVESTAEPDAEAETAATPQAMLSVHLSLDFLTEAAPLP